MAVRKKPRNKAATGEPDCISIKGARVHNLKNVDVDIPRNQLVVITGLSGSGKSSLAFDTLYAEGQRRYVESLSAYARQFLGQVEKPDVDRIDGLSPAIAIDQKTTSQNPRSTVGTITEIHDHLRLLYARIGKAHCPECKVPLSGGGIDRAVADILSEHTGRAVVYAPYAKGRKGTFAEELKAIGRKGFVRVRVDGVQYEVGEVPALEKNKKHDIEIVIDRVALKNEKAGEKRLKESVEVALRESDAAIVEAHDGSWRRFVAEKNSCPGCGESYPELEPRSFSFNSPFGACTECDGIGSLLEGDETLFVPDVDARIGEAIACFNGGSWSAGYQRQALAAMLSGEKIPKTTTWRTMDSRARELVLNGSEKTYPLGRWNMRYSGVLPWLAAKREDAEWYGQWMSEKPCNGCGGRRLSPYSLSVDVGGRSIAEVESLSIEEFCSWLGGVDLSEREQTIAGRLIKEITARSGFLLEVGLSYLTLDRAAKTLSGGEAQRIRLASQVGSGLVGVLYVLDEPSIGLHPRDNKRLLATLERLRDAGNTVVVVEHDEETIDAADWIVDVGPRAGSGGGEIVAVGNRAAIEKAKNSLTGDYLAGRRSISTPTERRVGSGTLLVKNAQENNLKGIDVELPLGVLVAITGVSGSGKSTLVGDILRPALLRKIAGQNLVVGKHGGIIGVEQIDKVIDIDQSPIGRTPRSNPATYTGVFDKIRGLYSEVAESRARGWKQGRFSFNIEGGRCEECKGDGEIKIEMHFLPDVYIPCEACSGTRYRADTLEILFKNKNIAEVLNMSVDEAKQHFSAQPSIARTLETLADVGLGYVKLGQSATQLSGGEAQRIKLAEQLQRRSTGRTLYLLDEPTTGLHFEDVNKLVHVLDRLVDAGNTVVVIEHNLDVVKRADWVIDLGPEGGSGGGCIVAEGTPEQVAQVASSWTGKHLQATLGVTQVREKP
jgi:excinuclease ABC subunit A